MIRMKKIAIIGAGFSGLATAKLLKIENIDVEIKIFEASDRIGGLINTTVENGYVMEWGPEALKTASKNVQRFLKKTKLDELTIPATKQVSKRYIVHKGKVRALPNGLISGLTTKTMSLRTKIGVFREPFVKAHRDGEESFGNFINRRLGKGLDHIIDAFISGVFGGDHMKLSVNYAFPAFKNLELEYGSLVKGGFKASRKKKKMMKEKGIKKEKKIKVPYLSTFPKGLTQVVNHLADGLDIQTNTPITSIVKNGSDFQLKFSNGFHNADIVVFASSPNTFLELDTSSLISEGKVFEKTDESYVNVVTLIYDNSSFKKETKGYGFLSPSKEGTFCLGILFVSDFFPEHAPEGKKLLRCFIGGIRHPEKNDMTDEELVLGAKSDVIKYLQVNGEPEKAFVARNKPLPQINLGHKSVVDYKQKLEKNDGFYINGVGWTGISTEHLMNEAENIVNEILRK